MKSSIFLKLKFCLYFFLTLPHYLSWRFSASHQIIKADVTRWSSQMKLSYNEFGCFIYLLMQHPEFRNLLYYRLGGLMYIVLNILLPKMNTLFINTPAGKIGPGLFIHHGFATIISAKEIGANCWINQQVTIGFTNDTDCPVLMNNVRIAAGAKVLGNIVCGNNCIVGANSVVTKNIPDNCTVAGIPAFIIKRNGKSTREPL